MTMLSAETPSDLMNQGRGYPARILGYDVIEFIGEGAGSLIYAVADPVRGQVYALKQVVRKNDKDARFIEQVVNEYEVARRISHPSLRRVIDLKLEKTLLRKTTSAALVMELFDGKALDVELPRSNLEMIDTFIKVAQALGAMHKAGFVHCDLKPANILRNRAGDVRVIDLGQACPINTQKERIQGTPDYIAPEQVKREPVDPRTDIYNLGATMYWCLCGQKLPTLYTIKRDPNSFLVDTFIKSPHDHNPMVPENLSSFVMECCKTARDKRPPDMQIVESRLELIRATMK